MNLPSLDLRSCPYHSPDWCERHLMILTKKASVVPLRMNVVQKDLSRTVIDCYDKGRPCRIMILKARQLGTSTWTEAVIYDRIRNVSRQSALILADGPKSSDHIYRMFRRYHLHDSSNPPPTEHMHQKGLMFKDPQGSMVTVDTAKRKFVGTGQTIQALHASEISKWDDPETTMLSLMQGLPNEPNTLGIIESTANGAGDYYNGEWDRAIAGENEWIPKFYAWFLLPEYSLDPRNMDMDGIGVRNDYNFYPGEETELIKQFNLDLAQMAWRRWCIRNNCGGDVLRFHQEYPSTAEEAFISSGSPRFDMAVLQKMKRLAPPPRFEGRTPQDPSHRVPEPKFIEDGKYLRVWEFAQPKHRYVIGADCAGTSWQGGDSNAASVRDRDTYPVQQVAVLHGVEDADTFAKALADLGAHYNWAVIAVEANGVGEAVLSHLRHYYPRHLIYRRMPNNEAVAHPGKKLGWLTTSVSRPNMIETMASAIRDEEVIINDPLTLMEAMSFHRVPGPRQAEHKPGGHDDCVFADMICLMCLSYSTAGEYRHYNKNQHASAGVHLVTEV